MTNIVVVQFSDYVQTGRDKRFNLTCLFRGPGEAVVTSGYIGAGYARSYRLRDRALHPVHLIKQSDLSSSMECRMCRIHLTRILVQAHSRNLFSYRSSFIVEDHFDSIILNFEYILCKIEKRHLCDACFSRRG